MLKDFPADTDTIQYDRRV